MHVTKQIDVALLATELAAAGVAVAGVGYYPTDNPGGGEVHTYDDGEIADLPPEAGPVVAAHDASKTARSQVFEGQEDAERLGVVAERAQTDPAFAALADLALGKGWNG